MTTKWILSFLFSEILIQNREKLKGQNLLLTLLKDSNGENLQKVNEKIVSLDEIINRSYDTISMSLIVIMT